MKWMFTAAILLLLPSRRISVDALRQDMAIQAARLDRQMGAAGRGTEGHWNAWLGAVVDHSSGKLAWIIVRDAQGNVLAGAGVNVNPAFSFDDVQAEFRDKRPVYAIRTTAGGPVVVEAFPVSLPKSAPALLRNAALTGPGRTGGVLEIASFLKAAPNPILQWILVR